MSHKNGRADYVQKGGRALRRGTFQSNGGRGQMIAIDRLAWVSVGPGPGDSY